MTCTFAVGRQQHCIDTGSNHIWELSASTAEASSREHDPNWLDSCQSYISEVHTRHSNIDKLIGNLYTQSYKRSVRDPDAVSFARAYKEALDAKKHGKQIYLPEYLWCKLDEDLHEYLVSRLRGLEVSEKAGIYCNLCYPRSICFRDNIE